ncbi:cyclase family protein [Glutamicibacter sp. PS]|uniref:cyclase family protein n=1 Tax=Glutamicibacter sp. PS TaxID=3075634 RepID=UPI0028416AFC|nr:cyclase family protein [Glutamicibacter sp. PS]MDR4534579.1 cyclase family protein [Glutamicibacter sp. PS]
MTGDRIYPTRSELKRRPGQLAGTSWELFSSPSAGAPEKIDNQKRREAAALVQLGETFGLDYPIDAFASGMSKTRGAPQHHIFGNHPAHRDDYLDGFYLQGSSQIDGLRHRRSDEVGFYGGVRDEQVKPGTPELGIQYWADHPIATRGVLVDLAAFLHLHGKPLDHQSGEGIPLETIQNALARQNIELDQGDALMIHTGWCEWFLSLDPTQRSRQRDSGKATGLIQSEELLDWAWDTGLSLVAADNFAVECLPPVPGSPFSSSAPNDRGMMHQEFLAKLGLPLGELWRLGALAGRMNELGRWDCLLIVKPLNVVGGTGSPANATALI